jgi:hypothetical protein
MSFHRPIRMTTLALLLLGPSALCAQELAIPAVVYPQVASAALKPEGFVPHGWKVELQAAGDLNGDGFEDVALILHATDPRNVLDNSGFGPTPFDTNPRMLVVALGHPTGGHRLVLANHSLIPRSESPSISDVLDDASPPEIKRGTLKIGLSLFANVGGSDMAQITYTFRYQKGQFMMIGYDSSSVQRMSGETRDISINYLTRKKEISTGRISSDRQRLRRSTLPAGPLLTIDQIGDGIEFDPETSRG